MSQEMVAVRMTTAQREEVDEITTLTLMPLQILLATSTLF
jgi:hypothetical protein